jgi:hypothetical protein
MSNQPKWLADEWCPGGGANCNWYSKITSVSGGPDTDKMQWLDWDETAKKFIWTDQTIDKDTGHRFWMQPNTKSFMRVAKNNDTTYPSLTPSGSTSCGTMSDVSDCVIHHDRGITCNKSQGACIADAFGSSQNCNHTSSCNQCSNSGTGYDNTTDVNTTGWYIDSSGDNGGIYARINEYTQFSSTTGGGYGPPPVTTVWFNNCTSGGDKRCNPPPYFVFGKPENGGNVGVYAGNFTQPNYGSSTDSYRYGCSQNVPAGPDKCDQNKTPIGNNDVTWISEDTAMNCCGTVTSDVQSYAQCGASGTPGGFNTCNNTGFCATLMGLNCNDNWSECSINGCTPGSDVCNDFLRNGNCAARNAVRANITAYINNPTRQPTDYISWKLRKHEGSPSYNYYNDHGCKTEPDGTFYEDPQNKDPCTRDDSKDPFFTNKLIYLCNVGSDANQPVCDGIDATMCYYPTVDGDPNGDRVPGNPTGRCDDLLHYFCQQFTRDDVEADATLVSICGCSLLPPGHIPYQPPGVDGVYWTPTEGIPPAKSAYDTNVPTIQCDTPCMSSQILQTAGSCVANYCVIDGVTLNYVNSDPGNTDITQQCGSCGEDGTCQCYMGNITVNEFNSKNKGGLSMSQYCGNCYQTDASGAYVPVNCQTGEPLNGPDGPDNGKKDDDTKPWWKKKVVLITVVILILAIVVFLGFWYSMHHKAKSVPTQVQTFDDYYYY